MLTAEGGWVSSTNKVSKTSLPCFPLDDSQPTTTASWPLVIHNSVASLFLSITGCRGHRLAPIVSPLSFSFDLILIRFPSYLRYPYLFTFVHLSRWFLSAFLLTAYYFTFGYAHCPLRSPTLLCHSFIQPDSFLLLCPRRLLILRAASCSFLVLVRQHDSLWPLTLYDSAFTVEYIRLSVLIVFSSV